MSHQRNQLPAVYNQKHYNQQRRRLISPNVKPALSESSCEYHLVLQVRRKPRRKLDPRQPPERKADNLDFEGPGAVAQEEDVCCDTPQSHHWSGPRAKVERWPAAGAEGDFQPVSSSTSSDKQALSCSNKLLEPNGHSLF